MKQRRALWISLLGLSALALCAGGAFAWHHLAAQEKPPRVPDTPGFAMVKNMRLGWNLGNTLDAHGEGIAGLDTQYCWGNPDTTQEMIDAVKAAGFATLRVPVTWANHFGGAPDYTIDEAWLGRVQEVVDYAYGIGMYVILNMHHDDHYWYIPDEAHEAALTAQYISLWEQICARFADYDERLLFQAFNEPRVIGSEREWKGGTPAERAVLGRLNAAFVQTVRGSGGQNAARWLLLPTYAASSDRRALRGIKLPKDERLIVSVHGYMTWGYASGPAGEYTPELRDRVDGMLHEFYRHFVARGIPVVITEFGAVAKEDEAGRERYAAEYVAEAARYGIACVWWDNGNVSLPEDRFSLLDRESLQWRYPGVVKALREAIV